jgi:hypothetical protein
MDRPAPHFAVTGRCLAIAVSLAAAVTIAGCQTPAAPFDPFLAGRDTIPPPGTAVPAATSPYYNAAPPTVTVPAPGATYTAPGAIPAAAPTISVPPAGAGQLPRDISVPQSSKPARGDGSQLATWQKSDHAKSSTAQATTLQGAKSGDNASTFELATAKSDANARSSAGVVRASHEEPAREAPIRIVEPAAKTAAAKSDDKPIEKSARGAPAFRGTKSPSRKLPELTDFPPAAGGSERTVKQ